MLFKLLITSVIVITFTTVNAQRRRNWIGFQFQDFLNQLNNITVSDISAILSQFGILNPLIFDGEPLDSDDVEYYLYTRKNPDRPHRLKATNLGHYNGQHPTKFIVHGWLENAERTYYRAFVDAYLRRGEYNVIGVDWARPALSEYTVSARNTKTAGRALGAFMMRLNKITGQPLQLMHILGHSLGAHLGGFAGKYITARTGEKIGRITALDAAGPLYEFPLPLDRRNRLDRNDAVFVDLVHTDGGEFGMTRAVGHVDYYPNGGQPRQPGCYAINVAQLSVRVVVDDRSVWGKLNNYTNIFRLIFCSHERSHEFYTESINSDQLRAIECNSYAEFRRRRCDGGQIIEFGEDVDQKVRGKFYFDTNDSPPFALT